MPPPRKRSPRPYPQSSRRPKVTGTTTSRPTETRATEEAEQPGTTGHGFDVVTGVNASEYGTGGAERATGGQVESATDSATQNATQNATDNAPTTTIPAADNPAADNPAADDPVADNEPTRGTDESAPGRDSATAEWIERAEKGSRTATVSTDEDTGDREARKLKVAAGLVVLALVFAGLAVWFSAAASSGNDTENTALTDAATTRAVQEQVSNDLNTIMSYDYKHPDRTTKAAKDVLGNDKLASDYSQIINVLESNGVKQKLSLRTKVITSGVERLRDDRAVVLVLASQVYSKVGDKQPIATTARLRVNAVRDGDRWRITNLKQY